MSSDAEGPAEEPAEQQPREERRPVSMGAFALLADGSKELVSIVDLSYDGCAIATPVEFKPGDRIKLQIVRMGDIDADVRWYKDGKAGLSFHSSKRRGTEEEQRTERAFGRLTIAGDLSVRRLGRAGDVVHVSDMSRTGFSYEYDDRPVRGERLLVRFEGLQPLEAKVRWTENGRAGCEFETPIHPAVFTILRAQSGASDG